MRFRESGARALPPTKKSREVVLLAVENSVRLFCLVLGEAATANVSQGNLVISVSVIMRGALPAAVLIVEVYADVVGFHERLGDTIDVSFSLGLLRLSSFTGAAPVARALAGGDNDGLPVVRVGLGGLGEALPVAFQAIVDGRPVFDPFELLVLPCHEGFASYLEDFVLGVPKTHLGEKLKE